MSEDRTKGSLKDAHYARLRRAFRDQKSGGGSRLPRPRASLPPGENAPDGMVRLYGIHTVRAALGNSRRKIARMFVTRNALDRLATDVGALPFPVSIVDPREIDRITGSEAVHQGVVIEARPLRPRTLDALGSTDLVVVLDQVTDPHNTGAIMRSAVAFGAGALITTARHSAQESGVLAKSASGALEHIDMIEVRNLADALRSLHDAGFRTIGLDSEAPEQLETRLSGSRIALVVGSEGKGLRQKTRETVAALARLDVPGPIASLNVSNAAAVALYAARRFLGPCNPLS